MASRNGLRLWTAQQQTTSFAQDSGFARNTSDDNQTIAQATKGMNDAQLDAWVKYQEENAIQDMRAKHVHVDESKIGDVKADHSTEFDSRDRHIGVGEGNSLRTVSSPCLNHPILSAAAA